MAIAFPARVQSQNIRGILAMLASMAAFVLNDALMKVAASTLPTGEVIFLRGLFAVPMLAVLMIATGGGRDILRAFAHRGILCRGTVEIAAAVLYLSALFHMPIADITAVLQATPLAITAGAALFLGAPVGWRRWLATLIGLAGVLVIIRPGASAFDSYAWLALLSVAFVAARDLITRQLDSGLPTFAIALVSMTLVALSGLGFLAFETWVWPQPDATLALLGAGIAMLSAQYWIILAMRTGEIAAVAPFRYSIILWAILAGYLVWHETPDFLSWIGIAIVTGAGLYTFLREQRLARAGRP
jgi:drug/metabolite transporter (DMT)-like permease